MAILENQKSVLNGVYYLSKPGQRDSFSDIYHRLRKAEGRIYDDEIVRNLPNVPRDHKFYLEWKMRKYSSDKLLNYLSRIKGDKIVLDLGCGNGWLTHKISHIENTSAVGMDVNLPELEQAARVFENSEKLSWVYSDIFETGSFDSKFDIILLSSVIAYFSNLKVLLTRLLSLLNDSGEIHILDSPFYKENDIENTRQRSIDYFLETGFPEMKNYYHHHLQSALDEFNTQVMYNPHTLTRKIARRAGIGCLSPFYWLRISKQKNEKN